MEIQKTNEVTLKNNIQSTENENDGQRAADHEHEITGPTQQLNNQLPLPAFSPLARKHDKSRDRTGSFISERADIQESRFAAAAGLSVILGQPIEYFSGRVPVDEIDTLSFSLHHLFCRVDFLYRTGLPDLQDYTLDTLVAKPSTDDWLLFRDVWTRLRTIKQVLKRIEVLCHLLSDVTICILDALDSTSEIAASGGRIMPRPSAHSVELEKQPSNDALFPISQAKWYAGGQNWPQTLNPERLDHALAALTECLGQWQENHDQLKLLINQFSWVVPTIPSLAELDTAFTILLDSAGAIFGDIVPGFQAISQGDDEAVATLLFDLMQQSDQLLIQCDSVQDPLHALIENFALGPR